VPDRSIELFRTDYTRLAVTKDKKAQLELIDDLLGTDETVLFDTRALLVDPGHGLKKREAEGYLVLTNQRAIFATVKHGVLIDLPKHEIKAPVTIRHKYLMSHLDLVTRSGECHSLVLKRVAASKIAQSMNEATTD
jgi:hypothetical protein